MALPALRTFPRITQHPDILGGAPVVRGTRTPVRAIAFLWRSTHDRARIREDYPHLRDADVDAAIAYYEAHQAEVDADIRANQAGED